MQVDLHLRLFETQYLCYNRPPATKLDTQRYTHKLAAETNEFRVKIRSNDAVIDSLRDGLCCRARSGPHRNIATSAAFETSRRNASAGRTELRIIAQQLR